MFWSSAPRVKQEVVLSGILPEPVALDEAYPVTPDAEARAAAARREDEALRSAMRAYVERAPYQAVVSCTASPTGYLLDLACGHFAQYFAVRTRLRCHACADQTSPTRHGHG